jgi:hypothetical protein
LQFCKQTYKDCFMPFSGLWMQHIHTKINI